MPVHELIAISEHVGKGNLSHDIMIQSHDEIGKLVKVFQYMVESLRLLIKANTRVHFPYIFGVYGNVIQF